MGKGQEIKVMHSGGCGKKGREGILKMEERRELIKGGRAGRKESKEGREANG